MITCSDLHGNMHYINPDLLQSIEMTPDTQLIFVNGHRLYVAESPEEIVERIIALRKRTGCGAAPPAWLAEPPVNPEG